MLSHFLKVALLTGNVAFRSRHGAPLTMGLMELNWAVLWHLQTQPARAFSARGESKIVMSLEIKNCNLVHLDFLLYQSKKK